MKRIIILIVSLLPVFNFSCFLFKTDVTENEPNNSFAQANHILIDYDNIEASIDPGDDKDFFTYDGLAGDSYTVNALYISGSLDLIIRIYNNEARDLIEDINNTSEAGDESVTFDVEQDGVIYIEIASFNSGSSGNYEVNVLTGKKVE